MNKIKIPRHGKTPIGAYFSPGVFNGGGGIIIFPGHDGKIHIKRIPPSAPVMEGLDTVASLSAQAEKSSNRAIKQQLHGLAESAAGRLMLALTELTEP